MAPEPILKASNGSLPTHSLDATLPSKRKQDQEEDNTTATTTTDGQPEPDAAISQKALKKAKRKDHGTKTPGTLHTSTFRKPRFTYLRIRLVTPESISLASTTTVTPKISSTSTNNTTITSIPLPQKPPPNDPEPSISPLTTLTLLTPSLTKFLGRTGGAIPIDILHCIARDAYIRVAREDARAVRAALSGWVGWCDGGSIPGLGDEAGKVRVVWRVVGEGGWLGNLSGNGEDLFEG